MNEDELTKSKEKYLVTIQCTEKLSTFFEENNISISDSFKICQLHIAALASTVGIEKEMLLKSQGLIYDLIKDC